MMTRMINPRSIYSELAELRNDNKNLQASQAARCPECSNFRLRELFSSASTAMAEIGKNAHITYANPAFIDIVGYSLDEISAIPIYELLVPEHDPEGRKYLHSIFSQADCKASLSMIITDRNDNQHFVDISVAGIPHKEELPGSYLCILHDVTAEKEAELRREELIDELMEVKELQEDNAAQLATLLHELDEKNLELEQEIAERKKLNKS